MSKIVITFEDADDGKFTVHVEMDEHQKGRSAEFTKYILHKLRSADDVVVVRRGAPPAPIPVVQYVDRIVEKIVYRDAPNIEEKPPTPVIEIPKTKVIFKKRSVK